MDTPKEQLYKELKKHIDQILPGTDQCSITHANIYEDSPAVELVVKCDADEIEEHTFDKLMQALYDISSRITLSSGIKITSMNLTGGAKDSIGFNIFDSSANLVDPVIRKYLVTATLVDVIPDKIRKDHYLLPTATVERSNKAIEQIRVQKNRPEQLMNKLEHYSEGEIELNLLTSMRETMRFRYEFNIDKNNVVIYSDPRRNYTTELSYILTPSADLTFTCIETDPEKLNLIKVVDSGDKQQMIVDFCNKMRRHLETYKIKFISVTESELLRTTAFNFPEVD